MLKVFRLLKLGRRSEVAVTEELRSDDEDSAVFSPEELVGGADVMSGDESPVHEQYTAELAGEEGDEETEEALDGDATEGCEGDGTRDSLPATCDFINTPATLLIERFAMVCFLEEIEHTTLPLDAVSRVRFGEHFARLQMMPRLEACVLCWEALARIGGESQSKSSEVV